MEQTVARAKKAVKVAKKATVKKLVNHVAFVLDRSGSMSHRLGQLRDTYQKIVAGLGQNKQEARITTVLFDDRISFVEHDTPLDLVKSLQVVSGGSTALMDATMETIKYLKDVEAKAASKKREDHSFLVYVMTDGGENASRHTSAAHLLSTINGLGEAWTVAAMVPDITGVHYAKNYGFPAGNIEQWDTNSKTGVEEVGKRILQTYSTYSSGRSMGLRSTSNLFQVNANKVSKAAVQNTLDKVDGHLIAAQADKVIRDFVEDSLGITYKKGCAYYELTKKETVQPYKEIVIISKTDSRQKYAGTEARNMLGLPSHDIKVIPGNHGQWRIFVQSTSVNRRIKAGTSVFVRT